MIITIIILSITKEPGGILRLAEVLRKDRKRGGRRSSGSYYGTGPVLRMYLVAEGFVPSGFFEPEPAVPEPYEQAAIP